MEDPTIIGDNSQSGLASIPLEVLFQITSNLTTPEFGRLRCTCKLIEARLFNSFSREFFTKRKFTFTEFSLQAFVDISKSRLSSCLSHVIFGLERPALRSYPSASQIASNTQPNIRVKNNRLLHEYAEHISFINSGQDLEMLVEAFSNLGNLQTVGMRDFNSRTRSRDYPNTEWKSYGASTFELVTGTQLEPPRRTYTTGASTVSQEQANYVNRVFLTIVRALGKACSRPKHFEVILRAISLHDHAFNLPEYILPNVQPVLANLRTLFLDLNSEFPAPQVDLNGETARCSSYLLRKFLSRVPLLEHLRLNFRSYSLEEANDVLTWLSKTACIVTSNTTPENSILESPRPVDFIQLRQLDIGMIWTEPQIVLAIIRKYRATLDTVSFHKVSFSQASTVESTGRVNLWARFFAHLSKLDLKLSAINLSLLSQEQAGMHNIQLITFEGARDPKSKRWFGTDTESGIRDIMNQLKLQGPENERGISDSNDSDGDTTDISSDLDSSEGDDNDTNADNIGSFV